MTPEPALGDWCYCQRWLNCRKLRFGPRLLRSTIIEGFAYDHVSGAWAEPAYLPMVTQQR